MLKVYANKNKIITQTTYTIACHQKIIVGKESYPCGLKVEYKVFGSPIIGFLQQLMKLVEMSVFCA